MCNQPIIGIMNIIIEMTIKLKSGPISKQGISQHFENHVNLTNMES